MKNNAIQLRVNETNLVNNLRHAFTRRSNVLSELMQNARRADATEIRFTVTHDQIIIEDDGNGIDDFSSLLTVATSGWDTETVQKENPFGMGFLAALYACNQIQVQSNGQLLEAYTQDILDQKKIGLKHSLVRKGSIITLMDTQYVSKDYIIDDITTLAKGFSIPVFINDHELDRPHAIDKLNGCMTDMGFFHIKGIHDGHFDVSEYTAVYLQGLPIKYNGENGRAGRRINNNFFLSPFGYSISNEENINVVHLDSERYLARVPDRDVLINPDEVELEMAHEIMRLFKDRLQLECQQLTPEGFINRRWSLAHSRHTNHHYYHGEFKSVDLRTFFNTLPVMPGSLFKRIVDYPYILKASEDADFKEGIDLKFISETDAQAGCINIWSLEELATYKPGLATAYMYAWNKDNVILLDSYHNIHPDHWIHQYVKTIDSNNVDECFSVSVRGTSGSATFTGAFIDKTTFYFATDCLISYEDTDDVVHIDSEAFVLPDGSVFYPEKEQSAEVIDQLELWSDENEIWLTDDQEREKDLLYRFALSERAGSDIPLIQQLLESVNIGNYSALHGKVFQLRVNNEGFVDIERC